MEDLAAAVDAYLRRGEFSSGIMKGEKANLRRKCHIVTISSWRKEYSTARRQVINRTGKL